MLGDRASYSVILDSKKSLPNLRSIRCSLSSKVHKIYYDQISVENNETINFNTHEILNYLLTHLHCNAKLQPNIPIEFICNTINNTVTLEDQCFIHILGNSPMTLAPGKWGDFDFPNEFVADEHFNQDDIQNSKKDIEILIPDLEKNIINKISSCYLIKDGNKYDLNSKNIDEEEKLVLSFKVTPKLLNVSADFHCQLDKKKLQCPLHISKKFILHPEDCHLD